MKLFEPQAVNQFVVACLPLQAREGVAPDYRSIAANDIESALRQLDAARLRPVYPHVLGRYDEKGRYMTYKPPVDGLTPGRFVLHPLAEKEMTEAGWH
jgi:hypothetical protein